MRTSSPNLASNILAAVCARASDADLPVSKDSSTSCRIASATPRPYNAPQSLQSMKICKVLQSKVCKGLMPQGRRVQVLEGMLLTQLHSCRSPLPLCPSPLAVAAKQEVCLCGAGRVCKGEPNAQLRICITSRPIRNID